MVKKWLFYASVLLTIVPFVCAGAAEQANNCRLKSGSMVMLAAEACVMEGGAVVSAAAPSINVESLQLSSEPKLAAAQRAVAELLLKPVVEKNSPQRVPQGIERTVKFDGCRMMVDEAMHIDRGNFISSRKNFKISSTLDFLKVGANAFSVFGKVSSLSGGMKTAAVYLEEPKRREGNSVAISVVEQKETGSRKYTLPASAAYWDAPNNDLWVVDEYGYPKDNGMGSAATDRVSVLLVVNTADEAVALKKSLDDVRALCQSK